MTWRRYTRIPCEREAADASPLNCFGNSFIEMYFTYHTNHPFKMYNSQNVFSVFTDFYNHYHNQL